MPDSGGDARSEYRNAFNCLPHDVCYRPARRTPRPVIHRMQSAVVVGLPGEQVFIDDYGRVQVRFHWDKDNKNSCWIRVGQIFAGPRYGAFFWPRAGNEVMVGFMHGDPDQPVIVGSVYISSNHPPLMHKTLDKYAVGIKTQIINADPMKHFNALMFFDAPGKAYVYLHSDQHLIDQCDHSRMRRHQKLEMTIHGGMVSNNSKSEGQ
jgi:type VI secretion system secreted protein VgrG